MQGKEHSEKRQMLLTFVICDQLCKKDNFQFFGPNQVFYITGLPCDY